MKFNTLNILTALVFLLLLFSGCGAEDSLCN